MTCIPIERLEEGESVRIVNVVTCLNYEKLAEQLAINTQHTAEQWKDTIIIGILRQIGEHEEADDLLGKTHATD